jgi:hypothetical protein
VTVPAAVLLRLAWDSPDRSTASCMASLDVCTWDTGPGVPAAASRAARKHTRVTGHATEVIHRRIVQYRKETR